MLEVVQGEQAYKKCASIQLSRGFGFGSMEIEAVNRKRLAS